MDRVNHLRLRVRRNQRADQRSCSQSGGRKVAAHLAARSKAKVPLLAAANSGPNARAYPGPNQCSNRNMLSAASAAAPKFVIDGGRSARIVSHKCLAFADWSRETPMRQGADCRPLGEWERQASVGR